MDLPSLLGIEWRLRPLGHLFATAAPTFRPLAFRLGKPRSELEPNRCLSLLR